MRVNRVLQHQTLMPESILPSQFWPDPPRSGAARLLSAILEDALETINNYCGADRPHGKRLFHEAYEWTMSDDATWLCSFENVCLILGLSPERLRERIKKKFGTFYHPEQVTRYEYQYKHTVPIVEVRGEVRAGNHMKDGYEVIINDRLMRLPYKSMRDGRLLTFGFNYDVPVSYYYAFTHDLLPDKPVKLRHQARVHDRKIATPRQKEVMPHNQYSDKHT